MYLCSSSRVTMGLLAASLTDDLCAPPVVFVQCSGARLRMIYSAVLYEMFLAFTLSDPCFHNLIPDIPAVLLRPHEDVCLLTFSSKWPSENSWIYADIKSHTNGLCLVIR
ncbi:hypothetical protein ILYODFUR_024369 [Ilyodon furcidens]|uniref:Uncharacterized protein n=1 Tax=Ilyodon furcidens TaxID=33524 RepID=A0ABV0TLL2_9TELE